MAVNIQSKVPSGQPAAYIKKNDVKSFGRSHENGQDENDWRSETKGNWLTQDYLENIHLNVCVCDEPSFSVYTVVLGVIIEQYYRFNDVTEHRDCHVKYG